MVVVDHRSLLEEGVVDTLMINSGGFRTPVGPIVFNDTLLPDNADAPRISKLPTADALHKDPIGLSGYFSNPGRGTIPKHENRRMTIS
jgi:hypothetical protein